MFSACVTLLGLKKNNYSLLCNYFHVLFGSLTVEIIELFLFAQLLSFIFEFYKAYCNV